MMIPRSGATATATTTINTNSISSIILERPRALFGPNRRKFCSNSTQRVEESREVGKWIWLLPALIPFSLGCWQLQRLQWKLGLIEERQRGMSQPPKPLQLPNDTSAAARFLHAAPPFTPWEVTGRFVHTDVQYVLPRTYQGRNGAHIITPFELSETGAKLLVNRGWVPSRSTKTAVTCEPYAEPLGTVTLTGLLRRSDALSTMGTMFVPNNEPERRRWYWIDIPHIAAVAHTLPVLLDVITPTNTTTNTSATQNHIRDLSEISTTTTTTTTTYPVAGVTVTELRNPHLQYAITWFSLSAALAVMARLFLKRPPPLPPSTPNHK